MRNPGTRLGALVVCGALLVTAALAGGALASPLLIYTRWVGDGQPPPFGDFDADGAFFSYCDVGALGHAGVFECAPNAQFPGTSLAPFLPGDAFPILPMGGIGVLDRAPNGSLDFYALASGQNVPVAFSGRTTLASNLNTTTFPGARPNVNMGPATSAIGFALSGGSTGRPSLFQASATDNHTLVVSIVGIDGVVDPKSPIRLTVPGTSTVSPGLAGADLLGFTADDDIDGEAELYVLHSGPAGQDHLVVSIYELNTDTLFEDVTLSNDPVATDHAMIATPFTDTYVGGFARTVIDSTFNNKEFVILTVDHATGLPPHLSPAMKMTLWRFQPGTGQLLQPAQDLQNVPFYTGATITGIGGLSAPEDDNCNGIDDNGNGQIDENFKLTILCGGLGACSNAVSASCSNGVISAPECVANPASAEILDGIDNDCDGIVDNLLEFPACAPNDQNWWCCPGGAPIHVAVNDNAISATAPQSPDDPNLDAAPAVTAGLVCRPIGMPGDPCNLRGATHLASLLRARPGIRRLCPLVAELSPGNHELRQNADGSHLFLGGGDLTLQGMGTDPTQVVVSAFKAGVDFDHVLRVMAISPVEPSPVSVTFKNLTVRDGFTPAGFGGAVFAQGTPLASASAPRLVNVTVDHAIFTENRSNQPGGAIAVTNGTLKISDSIFRHNQGDNIPSTGGMTSRGGAVYGQDAVVNINRSAFVDNGASKGGAISVRNTDSNHLGTFDMINTTIARNFCGQLGCGLELDDISANLRFNTITANVMTSQPGPDQGRSGVGVSAIWTQGFPGSVQFLGNIIAQNVRPGGTPLGSQNANPMLPPDGQSPDCHIDYQGTAPLTHNKNIIGEGGLDCEALGDPGTDTDAALIGQGTAFGSLVSVSDPPIDPQLDAATLHETPSNPPCNPNAPGIDCQQDCQASTGADDCYLTVPFGTPPHRGVPPAACLVPDDQRGYLRPLAPTNCTVGSYEYYGSASRSEQVSFSVLPRGGFLATASSTGGGVAAAAVDNDLTTRFSTGVPQTQGQWFSMDMQTPQIFSQITLDPGVASPNDYPRQYQVFVSDDALTWRGPIASGTGAAGVLSIPFPTQAARFVGVVQTGSATNWWSIAEFNVYGPGSVLLAPITPTGWIASASATNGSEVASRALDGTLSTRWSTGVPQVAGQSFQVDMLQARTITGLLMDSDGSTSDYARGYQIFATNDPSNWGTAIASGAGTTSKVTVTFPQVSARYLKIVQTGSASNSWSIAELTVYGIGSFAPVATVLPRAGWTATATPSCSSDVASNAIDDQSSTRFSTCQNQTPGQTFQLDMQTAQTFSQITLDAGASNGDYPRAYAVYATNDLSIWGSPIATGTGSAQLVSITFPSQTARYLKIVQTGSTSSNWWSIAELNVYGAPPAVLLRDGWTAHASLNDGAASAGIDATLSTRWTTNTPQASGQWYRLDVGSARTFNLVRLDSDGASSDYPRGYQVFVSNDGTNFGSPIATGAATSSLVSIGFPVQHARYVKIVQTGSSSNWWSISEANLWAPSP